MTIRARAFTLMELLVVIAILALLVGLLLPGLSKARDSARSMREVASISQVAKINASYSNDFKDEVIPARIPKYWIWWNVCTINMYPPDPEDRALRMTRDSMRTWPWRLIGYAGTPVDDVWVVSRSDLELFRNRRGVGRTVTGNMVTYTDSSYAGAISEHVSFGMNSVFFGGDTNYSAFKQHGPNPCGTDAILPKRNAPSNGGNFYVTKVSDVQYPSDMITFAASRAGDVQGTGYHSNGTANADSLTQMRDGYYRVLPPASVPRTPDPDHGSAYTITPGWTNMTSTVWSSRTNQSSWGYLNARYFGTVATARVDGSARRMKLDEMRNMKHWDNFAPQNTNSSGVYAWQPRR